MSARERCLSVDRAKRLEQNVCLSSSYMPERSPHRSPARTYSSPNTPDILRDSFHGVLPTQSFDEFETCPTPRGFSGAFGLQHELESEQHQRSYRSPGFPQLDDLPDEDLADFDQPSFYEPAHSSFDELMCILASRPSRRPISPANHLSPQGSVDKVAACPVAQSPRAASPRVASPRAASPRAASPRAEGKVGPQFCPYRMAPLPDDPYEIPPHPKDPNDVVGSIRLSRALHRLKNIQDEAARKQKNIEEAGKKQQKQQEAAKRQLVGAVRKGVGAIAQTTKPTLCVPKKPGISVNPQGMKQFVLQPTKRAMPQRALPQSKRLIPQPKRAVPPPKKAIPQPRRAVPPTEPRRAVPPPQPRRAVPPLQPRRVVPPPQPRRDVPPPQLQKALSQPLKPNVLVPKKTEIQAAMMRPSRLKPPQVSAICKPVQLATLKTNAIVLPKSKIVPMFQRPQGAAAPLAIASAQLRLQPPRSEQFLSFAERAAAYRAASMKKPAQLIREEQTVECPVATISEQLQPLRSPRYQEAPARDTVTSLSEFEDLERQLAAECALPPHVISQNISLDEFEELERQTDEQYRDASLDEFEACERQIEADAMERRDDGQTSPFGTNVSLDEFEAFERQCNAQAITDEFEALTELQSKSPIEAYDLRNRIESLKTKLLASAGTESENAAISKEYSPRQTPKQVPLVSQSSPVFGLPPVIRYFELVKQMAAEPSNELNAELDDEECEMPEFAVNPNQFEDVADWKLADLSSAMQDQCSTDTKSPRSPTKTKAPTTSADICLSPLNTTLLDAIHMSDLDFEDIPMQSFSTDEVCDIDDQTGLADMVADNRFEEDINCNEMDIENITYTELDDLSISEFEGYSPQTVDGKDLESTQDQQTAPGFLTTVVNAVVEKFRNMFGGTAKDVEEDEDEQSQCINLDSSLPNMFETTPPPTPSGEEEFTTPKYSEEYIAMIKQSQEIFKRKQKEAEEAAAAAEAAAKATKARKPVVKSTIPKRAPRPVPKGKPSQKKQLPPKKEYPPGEYSPSYLAEIARSRTLAGYKNRSALLNPERAAKIAAIKAAKEAELAAEAALPPVERMRKRMARLQQQGKRIRPKPTIESLGALEAIRENLPRPKSFTKSKWTPAIRRRIDRDIESDQRVFTKEPTRIFQEFTPLTPLTEESYNEEDFIRFTPLRARECRLRLQHLQDQAQQRARRTDSPTEEDICLPETSPVRYSPIRLHSPTRSRTEDTITDGKRVGEKSITEEVTKTSTIENGEVHTTTRKVTTKTDEFGNVSCHVEEDTGVTGEDEAFVDNIDAIEAPEFLNVSDTEPQRDPSIPTPSEIIDKIRMQVQQKLNMVLPELTPLTESATDQDFSQMEFPDDLPDEQLYEIDMPELNTTPSEQQVSAAYRSSDISLPLVFGEEQPVEITPVICPPPPDVETSIVQKLDSPVKTKSTEESIVLPPLPTNPKDYVGMVKYARALDKLKKQQAAKCPPTPPKMVVNKPARVPISRHIAKPAGKTWLKSAKKPVAKFVRKPVGKLQPPKKPPTKIEPVCEVEEIPSTPPLPPPEYLAEIATARTLAGYKNRTAALNPKVAAELAEYEALSDYQKILRRMEKVRKLPTRKPKERTSTDIIATLEAIKACMPDPEPDQVCISAEESKIAQLATDEFEAVEDQCTLERSLKAIERSKDVSLDEFEELERQLGEAELLDESAHSMSLDEIKAMERQMNAEAQNQSLDEFEAMEREICEIPGFTVAPLESEELGAPESPAESGTISNRIQTLKDQLLKTPEPIQQFPLRKRLKELQRTLVGAADPEHYRELIQDFRSTRPQYSQIVIGDLEPVDPREKLRRIKERQQQSSAVQEVCELEDSFSSPSIAYSPVGLSSPTAENRPVKTPEMSLGQPAKRDILVDLESPKIPYRVKQFKDLDDMPFDDLAFEDEPSFANASYEKPISPPPKPKELISKIRRKVQDRLRIEKQNQIASMSDFQFPDELPEEDLFDLTGVSLAHTTLDETPKPVSPRSISPARTITPQLATQQEADVIECSKLPSPIEPGQEFYRPKVPPAWVEQVMTARAIHKQKQAEMAAAPPPQPPLRKGRIPMPRKPISKKPSPKIPIPKKPVGRVVVKKGFGRPQVVTRRKDFSPPIDAGDQEYPSPPLPPPEYLEEIARARTMAGFKNRTAALNPDVAAFEALPEYDQIKIRIERLRKKPSLRHSRAKPTMEQLAFIQAMKVDKDYQSPIRPPAPAALSTRRRLFSTPRPCRIEDAELSALSEFEALEFEALEQELASPVTCPRDLSSQKHMFDEAHEQLKMRADAQMQQLRTPPRLDARERYRRLISQAASTPKPPTPDTPTKTPEIYYSPVAFPVSPAAPKKPQQFLSRQLITEDDLAGIEEPSFLDTTPVSPTGVPRPRDIIERVRIDLESRPKPPIVPTGQLIDLRTPPRGLPLPQDVIQEELVEVSCPALAKTPPRSPRMSPGRSSARTPDVSLPEVFAETPDPPLPPVSPLRYRVHSPAGPIIIPPYPDDPNDYKALCRMSRKIYELKLQQETEAKAEAEVEAAAAAAAIEAAKSKKKERVPLSRWVKPPQRAPTKRKKLVMRKPGEKTVVKQPTPLPPPEPSPECPSQPSPLPAEYIAEINRARQLAGLRNVKRKLEFPPELSGTADYSKLTSKMDILRQRGQVQKAQPSLQAAAYLSAVKSGMDFKPSTEEPAETRYRRILEARAISPRPASEEICEEEIQCPEDIYYSPVPLGSPTPKHRVDVGFNMSGFDDAGDLEEIQEPSFYAESPSCSGGAHRFIHSSPKTPVPTPSAIIRRIRAQVHEKLASKKLPSPMPAESPVPLLFPEELPDEELMELSAPYFTSTPESRSPSPVYSPNVSIPQYFEEPAEICEESTPPPRGIIPGLRVLTPEGPFVLPPPPKGKESDIEMVRRAQLIHKIKTKEEAAKKAAEEAAKEAAKAKAQVRVPISRRIGGPTTIRPTKRAVGLGKPKVVPKKQVEPQEPIECQAETPKLLPEYIAEIARARRLAGLQNTRPELNPPQNYKTILARLALLRAGHGETEPTVQEMIEAENVIRRRERKEPSREAPQQRTPRPALERFLAYRSRFKEGTTPTTSRVPCSPVKTPVLPEYEPIRLRPTPPFLQNINMSDLEDISMPISDSMGNINEDNNLGDSSQYCLRECPEIGSHRMDRRR